jgi:hypothetical protein
MIQILIPNNNIQERKYILDIIFNEFLGLKYELIEEDNCEDWIIEFENKKILTIKDTFFSKYPKDLEYLKFENIPKKIEEMDIFAASFFMLTRWEEYVNKIRDKHNRFPAIESLAYKQGFLDKPIVNEFIENLKNKLLEFDNSLVFKKHEFKLTITHDIDFPFRYLPLKKIIKALMGDLLKRRDFSLAFENTVGYINSFFDKKKDPYNTFDYLMSISESIGTKSYFFLHSSNHSKYDIDNKKYLKIIANNITKKGHFLGYHPSYDSYNDEILFQEDKKKLEKLIEQKLLYGRGHYLRFEIPTTWQIWEDSGMKWDSSLAYADKEGFRCGVCYEYSVFNILTRKKLNLKEKPLIVMDGNFITYQPNVNHEYMKNKIVQLINEVKKYNGNFVFLWHNSSFNNRTWKNFQDIYEKVLFSI